MGEGRRKKEEGKIGVVCRYGPDGFCPAVAIDRGRKGGKAEMVLRGISERMGSLCMDG